MGPIQNFILWYLEYRDCGSVYDIVREHKRIVTEHGYEPYTVLQVKGAARRLFRREMIDFERIDGCLILHHLMCEHNFERTHT